MPASGSRAFERDYGNLPQEGPDWALCGKDSIILRDGSPDLPRSRDGSRKTGCRAGRQSDFRGAEGYGSRSATGMVSAGAASGATVSPACRNTTVSSAAGERQDEPRQRVARDVGAAGRMTSEPGAARFRRDTSVISRGGGLWRQEPEASHELQRGGPKVPRTSGVGRPSDRGAGVLAKRRGGEPQPRVSITGDGPPGRLSSGRHGFLLDEPQAGLIATCPNQPFQPRLGRQARLAPRGSG